MLLNIIRRLKEIVGLSNSVSGKSRRVLYKFNFPGLRNFHLLPYRSNRTYLNTFRPHWNGIKSMGSRLQQQVGKYA